MNIMRRTAIMARATTPKTIPIIKDLLLFFNELTELSDPPTNLSLVGKSDVPIINGFLLSLVIVGVSVILFPSAIGAEILLASVDVSVIVQQNIKI